MPKLPYEYFNPVEIDGVRNEYNKIEKSSVIVQIIVSIFVIIYAVLFIAEVVDNNYVTEMGMGIVMITQGVREWRKNNPLAMISFSVALLIVFTAVRIFLKRIVYLQ